MYTEEDLRATLGALEHEAPEMARTLAGMERRRHRRTVRRRTVGMLSAAAVTVALAAASITLPNLFDSQTSDSVTAAKQYSERWRFHFAVDDIPGHKVAYFSLGTKKQSAHVFADNETIPRLALYVFAAGVYDPTAAKTGEPVQVNGKPGFYRADMPCHCSGNPPVPGLAWEYAPNAWALVQDDSFQAPGPDPKGATLRVAKAVRFDRTTPLRVPFRVGYLPKGLVPAQGDDFGAGSMRTMFPGNIGASVGLAAADSQGPGLSIQSFGQPSDGPLRKPIVIGKPDRVVAGPSVTVNIGHSSVQLSSGGEDKPELSIEELNKIAASITAAPDLDDSRTWFEAEQVIPIS